MSHEALALRQHQCDEYQLAQTGNDERQRTAWWVKCAVDQHCIEAQ
jgi:hypothetical protein